MKNSGEFKKYIGRKSTKRSLRDIILIVCVGETEEIYFDRFKLSLGKVCVKTIQEASSPTQLIERAYKEKISNVYAQVWCVFDKDDFADFDSALKLAESRGIRVAFSNQAFELWYILHYEKMCAAFHREKYKSRLSKLLSMEYSKTDEKIHQKLDKKIDVAIQNAKWGHETKMRDYPKDPPSTWESCTTVYQLVQELNKWR